MVAQGDGLVPCARQRGFTLLDVIVGIALFTSFVLATASAFGMRAPNRHLAALALQAALVEARSLALTTADATDLATPTGATVVVAPDPLDRRGSVIRVFRSRPIPNLTGGNGESALVSDLGFPAQHVHAKFPLTAGVAFGSPFAILISSSGYASIADPYVYSAANVATIAVDPGCNDAGVTIAVSDGAVPERHPFGCRDASYDVSVFQ